MDLSAAARVRAVNLGPDVLRLVFQLFDTGYNTEKARESKLNLFRCALACKQFLNPALDALWYWMDSLVPLVQLLPSVKIINGAHVLCGPVDDSHWARFDAYARRVKKLYLLERPKTSFVATNTYIQLFSLRKSPLLPALHQLSFRQTTSKTLSDAFLLLSPTLNDIELAGLSYGNSHIIEPFLNSLASGASNIRRLSLSGRVDTALSSLPRFHHLKYLMLITNSISPEEFQQLGALPCLESLHTDLVDSLIPPRGTHIGFKQLKCCKIMGLISSIRSILEGMECKAMEKLVMTVLDLRSRADRPSSPQALALEYRNEWEKCFSVMYKQWPLSLSFISITQSNRMDLGQMWSGISSYLSQWPKLETLKFEGFQASSELVRQLALTCPQIRVLDLLSLGAVQSDIIALRILAELCPKLVVLRIEFDVRGNLLLLNNEADILSHPLQSLELIFNSKIIGDFHAISHIAKYIDRLFPNLSMISVRSGSDQDLSKIKLMVEMYQSARSDERVRQRDARKIL